MIIVLICQNVKMLVLIFRTFILDKIEITEYNARN